MTSKYIKYFHWLRRLFSWPYADYGKNLRSRETAHAQTKYQDNMYSTSRGARAS